MAFFDLARRVSVDCFAMLPALVPATFVGATIWPAENAMPLLFVVDVTPYILAAVLPSEDTLAVHPVVLPLSNVLAPVRPLIGSITFHLVLGKGAYEVRAVLPAEPTSAVFAPI